MMFAQILVCVPSSKPHFLKPDEKMPPCDDWLLEPIGMLLGFDPTRIEDGEILAKELARYGLTLSYLCRHVRADHNRLGAMIAFAVEAPTWEEAQKLPGFVPFGDWTGAFSPNGDSDAGLS